MKNFTKAVILSAGLTLILFFYFTNMLKKGEERIRKSVTDEFMQLKSAEEEVKAEVELARRNKDLLVQLEMNKDLRNSLSNRISELIAENDNYKRQLEEALRIKVEEFDADLEAQKEMLEGFRNSSNEHKEQLLKYGEGLDELRKETSLRSKESDTAIEALKREYAVVFADYGTKLAVYQKMLEGFIKDNQDLRQEVEGLRALLAEMHSFAGEGNKPPSD